MSAPDSVTLPGKPIDERVRRQMGALSTKLFYGFGSVAFGVKDQGFALLLFFYNQVLGAPVQMVTGAIAIALAFDAFADPIVGQISDNLRTPWGRRHPFMYGAAFPVAIAYFFLWNPPQLSGQGQFLYLVVGIVVVRTFITMYEIPSSSLVAELTPDYDQRTSFLGWRYLFGWLGSLTMTLLAFGVFFRATAQYPQGQLNRAGYVPFSLTACALMVFAIFVTSIGTHRFIPYFNAPPKRPLTLWRIFAEMGQTLRNRSFIVLTVSAIFGAVAGGTLGALSLYFATYFWGLSAGQIFLLSIITILAPVTALFLAPAFSSRVGKKAAAMTLWIVSTVFYWAPMASRIFGVFPRNGDPAMVPLLALLQTTGVMFSIACQITLSSMLADVVEDSQRITGRRSEGLFFASYAFVLKAVSGGGTLVAGLMLAFVHFPAHANPATLDPQIPRHLAVAYFPVTFALYAVALGCLCFYRISRSSHEENLRTLAAEADIAPVAIGPEGPRTPDHPAVAG
jgi:GPH family glycoside/pentoside/hexuronide:cation symporter